VVIIFAFLDLEKTISFSDSLLAEISGDSQKDTPFSQRQLLSSVALVNRMMIGAEKS
jgi:hypothetical protein